ncbi:hypothetical protein [uncultured Desulfosarcina sp.]|uniref:hypothetical protein n=1 Tax=uncultured Desulfosarcina sp. TaxID=218289 RepID=UPI0029C7AB0C|nr:hypothetical protein [uncultured Desulfosarcina sp.]
MLAILLAGCGGAGDEPDDSLAISGTIRVSEAASGVDGPVLVAVFNTADLDRIESDTKNAVVGMVSADASGSTFSMDLSETGLAAGDGVYVAAFIDADYSGSLPYPTPGDWVGFYVDGAALSPLLRLNPGGNDGIHIDIDRRVYDYEARISGTVDASESGTLTLIAYTGPMETSDFSKLETDRIIAYRQVKKSAAPLPYNLRILPYGYDLPVEDVQVYAFLDVNGNESMDAGDRIGYHCTAPDEPPSLLTIESGLRTGIDIAFTMDVMEPSGHAMRLTGNLTAPDGYPDEGDAFYLLIADTDLPGGLFEDPLAHIKAFQAVVPDSGAFEMDLSHTDLSPGDRVMVAALWDRDYQAGFPWPTPGDYAGLLQNNTTYAFTLSLSAGDNSIPAAGWELDTNRIFYDFDAHIAYALDLEGAGAIDPKVAQVMVILLHADGLNLSFSLLDGIQFEIDMDYVLAMDVIPAADADYFGGDTRQDPAVPRQLHLLPAVVEQLAVWEESQPPDPLIEPALSGPDGDATAFLVAVLDCDGDLRLGLGDKIGYWSSASIAVDGSVSVTIDLPGFGEIEIPDWLIGLFDFPSPLPVITNGENLEARSGQADGPYWIEVKDFL